MALFDKHRPLSVVLFLAVSILVYATVVIYFVNIIQWKDTPDWGFGFRNATGIHVVGVVRDRAYAAGLRIGDRILSVNGKPYQTYLEFVAIKNWGVDEPNVYLVERDSQKISVTIVNTLLGFQKTFTVSGFPFLAGLCYILIGTLVFLMKPHQGRSWTFLIFTTIVGLFLTTLFKVSVVKPFWFENIIIFIFCFMAATFFHLAINFPEERRILKNRPYLQLLPYLVSAVIFVGVRANSQTMLNAPMSWMNALVAYLGVGVLIFIGSCIALWVKSKSEMVKRRAKMILLGFMIAASMPMLDFAFNTLFKIYLVPGFNYYLPFFIALPTFIAYSIVKHDLFDFDAIIKRTYGYMITTGIIAGLYGIFVFSTNLLFGHLAVSQSKVFTLIFILAIVFLFNPVKNRVQRIIDRLFYRLEYNYRETVQQISESMRSLMKLDDIGNSIMGNALGTMFIDSGRIFLLDREKNGYAQLCAAGESETGPLGESRVASEKIDQGRATSAGAKAASGGEVGSDPKTKSQFLSAEEPLIGKLSEKRKEITIYDIEEDPLFKIEKDACARVFDQLEASLIVPLIYEDQLTGLISLGRKKSGKFYRREDINLLNTLANQGAVAIENAILLEEVIEKERMEEELAIAQDLQTSMLPATCPEVPGFDIAAYSMSAKEVGGDFYDFIETGRKTLGIVVGDVTGKSVSGALVMSASRSIFRMLSEENIAVGEIMMRANARTKKDIKTGMFVALLYAVLDPASKTILLCSAGQAQPMYLSAESDKVELVETKGDTFPLGILDEVDYQETRLDFVRGDKIILYSDGIVEAMNDTQEMFGFNRLQDVFGKTQGMGAEATLKRILEDVTAFVGETPQHDDLTVIVIAATQ